MSATLKLLQFKVALLGIQPPIWREIMMRANDTFFALHVAIQDAFGWQNCHLHQFFTESPYSRNSRSKQIALPMPEMEDAIDERDAKLSDWFKKQGDARFYEYDFGDSWMHEIILEKMVPAYAAFKAPLLLNGARACPPDDCGGIGGYMDLLHTLADPKSPDHKDMLDWLGIKNASKFNPEAFDRAKIRFHDPKKRLKAYEAELRG